MFRELFHVHGNWHELTRANKQYLRGKPVTAMVSVAHKIFTPRIHSLIFPVMSSVIEHHRMSGDLLLLLTGTLDFIAECFASELQFDGYKASTLETLDDLFTGNLVGIQPYGIGKLEVMRDLRKEFSFDQNTVTLYANLYSDRYVMNTAEEPVAVNPDKALRRYAIKNGWKIIDP
jgi:phosphoserine phosphatase